MNDAAAHRTMQSLKPVCMLIVGAGLAIFTVHALSRQLWADELLTMALVQAQSLPRLWTGIVSGIDGNPPLYLTLAWLISHAAPAALPTVAVLKTANLVITIAAMVILYRISLRVVSATAAWIGMFLLLALSNNISIVAFELRTYALYLLLAATAIWLQQRLIERCRTLDAVLLALACAALVLSHTFGIVYVGCIALAGWLSQCSGRRDTQTAILTTAPAILVLACWMPFFLQQSAVGRPYLWITSPTVAELLLVVFASPFAMNVAIVEMCCLATAAVVFARQAGIAGFRSALSGSEAQPRRFLLLVVLGFTAIMLVAWLASLLLFPLFVARYFTPQLIVSLALHVAFCELAVRVARNTPQLRTPIIAGCAIAVPAFLSVALLANRPEHRPAPCMDASGAAFEEAFVKGDLPVITESPHLFLPRATYAAHAASYRFALDWDVVMNYPHRSPGNATEYNVLENLRAWADNSSANKTSIMQTDDILKYPQFLAIEQSGWAWFHNLRNTRDLTAEKLADVTGGGHSCTLWKVTGVKPRR